MGAGVRKIKIYNLVAFSFITSVSSPALGADTVAYRYDDLGRLIESKTTGGPNNSLGQTVVYDPAGNRTSLVIGGAGGPPDPPPPPPTNNNAPIANPDSLSLKRCYSGYANVLANDTDPDGDVPLSIIDVQADDFLAQHGTVIIQAPSLYIETPSVQYNSTYYIDYIVEDARGARATGRLTLTVNTNNTNCN